VGDSAGDEAVAVEAVVEEVLAFVLGLEKGHLEAAVVQLQAAQRIETLVEHVHRSE